MGRIDARLARESFERHTLGYLKTLSDFDNDQVFAVGLGYPRDPVVQRLLQRGYVRFLGWSRPWVRYQLTERGKRRLIAAGLIKD